MLELPRRGRFAVCCWLAFAALISSTTIASRAAAEPQTFEIAAGSAADTLREFGKQAKLQTLFNYRVVKDLRTQPIAGLLEPDHALTRMLAGTGLTFQRVNEHTIAIRSAQLDPQASSDQAPAERTDAAAGESPALAVEEIIVTAQKRIERVQDVPVPVTALSAESLASSNQVLFRDYFSSIPALTVTPTTQSGQIFAIRGITTGSGNPTVGITVDDMPYGASTFLGGGAVVPDVDPSDLARVEVLRGPQGTLYGASSMGGLVKFVTREPDSTSLRGRLQVGLNGAANGDDLGYNVRGSMNLPLGDTFAMGLSGFHRNDPGYIDNVQSGERSINQASANGGRLAARWQPADNLTLKLNALAQEIEGDGSSDVNFALGDLKQSNLRGSGAYERKVQAYTASLEVGIGAASLMAISGYNENAFSDSFDVTSLLGAATNAVFGVTGTPFYNENETRKLTQELRLTMPLGSRVEWLVGGFYTDEDSMLEQTRLAVDPVSGARVGTFSVTLLPTTYAERAAFTNFTVHLAERFDIQLGARASRLRQQYSQTVINSQGAAAVIPNLRLTADSFTYLVTPRFKLTPDVMLYARLASGYRAGGLNSNPGGVIPLQYEPDETRDYELGMKGDFLDRKLSIDASLYYIDWKDLQITLATPAPQIISYQTNGSRAKSAGLELAAESRPVTGLTLSGWVAWNEAELTEAFPAGSTAFGVSGNRLPYSSRFSGSVSLRQDFPVWAGASAFASTSVTYVGDRLGRFTATALRQEFPDYTKVDVSAGFERDSWTASVFVNNVTDRRGLIGGGIGTNPAFAFYVIPPRTAGLSLSKTFQ